MYRPSKRSASTPRLRSALPARRATKDTGERPAWNDTQQDLDKYKATPEQIARRKMQRVSKHKIALNDDCRMSVDGYFGNDQASLTPSPEPSRRHSQTTTGARQPVPSSNSIPEDHAGPDNHHGDQTKAQHMHRQEQQQKVETAAKTPESTAASPPVDYGAVLRLLQQGNCGAADSPGLLPSESTLINKNNAGQRADLASTPSEFEARLDAAASISQDASKSASRNGNTTESNNEVLDATLSAFGRLEMAGNIAALPPSNALILPESSQQGDGGNTSTQHVASSQHGPQKLDSQHKAQQPLPASLLLQNPNSKRQGALSSVHHGYGQDHNHMTVTSVMSDMSQSHQSLEARVAALEGLLDAVANTQQQQKSALSQVQLTNTTVQSQYELLVELRNSSRDLQAEQSQLRAQFVQFSNETSTIISRLQAQMQQLLQTRIGDSLAALNTPATSELGPGKTAQRSLTAALSEYDVAPGSVRHMQGMQNSVVDRGDAEDSSLLGRPSQSLHTAGLPRPMHSAVRTSLFTDLPPQTASDSVRNSIASSRSYAAPVQTFDDSLELPSYASMRRSSASMTAFTASSRKLSSASNHNGTPAIPSQRADNGNNANASSHNPGGQAHQQLQQDAESTTTSSMQTSLKRYWPTMNYQPRKVAEPVTAWFASGTTNAVGSNGQLPGSCVTFPEPMSFDVQQEFKVVAVGGKGNQPNRFLSPATGLNPENSLSLLAHSAAAQRRS